MKVFFLVCLAIIVVSCKNDQSESPYQEVLAQPPYASITDSIRKEPGRDDLYFRRAILLNKNNYPEPALADFQKAWSIAPNESYAVGVSNILLEKRPDSAIVFLNHAIEALPKSIFLRLSLAKAYDSTGKKNEALAAIDALLQQEPGQVNALLLKADLLVNQNDNAGAVTVLEKAYSIMPSNIEISHKLAYQYAEAKNKKALELADILIAKDSMRYFADPFYVKGMYYSNTGDHAKAIQLFDETIRIDHRYLNAYIEKGKILLDQRKTQEALNTFELANRITPSFPDAWYWMGRAMESMGKKAEAKENYEKAYELDNTFIDAREASEKIGR